VERRNRKTVKIHRARGLFRGMDFRDIVRGKNVAYQWYEQQAIARQRGAVS